MSLVIEDTQPFTGSLTQAIEVLMQGLKRYKPYVYHEVHRGASVYIKFKGRNGLRTIRVSDHSGRHKYRYKWNLRSDIPTKVEDDRYVSRFYYNIKEVSKLIQHIINYNRKLGS